jgi:hypothetical protein
LEQHAQLTVTTTAARQIVLLQHVLQPAGNLAGYLAGWLAGNYVLAGEAPNLQENHSAHLPVHARCQHFAALLQQLRFRLKP